MHSYALAHLSDAILLRDLAALVTHDRTTTAALLAHIAEVDARRLYVPAGYPSMHAYCVEGLHLSEDAAYKRIQAARAARQFPGLFPALAEGRLHLAAVCLLAPHLTEENTEALIEVATHRRKSEIEAWLVRRFAAAEAPVLMRAVMPIGARSILQLAPGQVESESPTPAGAPDGHAPQHGGDSLANGSSFSPEHYLLQLTIGKNTQEKLRYAQALLSHALPTGIWLRCSTGPSTL